MNEVPESFDLVVTRFPTFAEYCRRIGIIEDDTPVITRARTADVRDKHVLGALPVFLAAEAESVTIMRINKPVDFVSPPGGMSMAELEEYAGDLQTYQTAMVCRQALPEEDE